MEQALPPAEPAIAAKGTKGSAACAGLGAVYFLAAFFAGGAVGLVGFWLIALLMSRTGRFGWDNFFYELPSLLMKAIVVSAAVGAWLGMRCYKPAATSASGQIPKPPAFVSTLMNAPRGVLAMAATYFVPRWELLIGATKAPWNRFLRVMGGAIVATAILFPWFLGRDADWMISIWLCGGLATIIADCLLVNKVAQWRDSGQLKPAS